MAVMQVWAQRPGRRRCDLRVGGSAGRNPTLVVVHPALGHGPSAVAQGAQRIRWPFNLQPQAARHTWPIHWAT